MTKNLLVLNCNELLVERLRQEMGDELEIFRCHTFEDLRQAWQRHRHARVAVGYNGHSNGYAHGSSMRESGTMAASLNGSGMFRSESPRTGDRHGSAVCATEPVKTGHIDSTPEQSELEAGHTLADQVDWFERQVIARTLQRNGQHRKDTAAELGISRVTLYNKMKKFGLLD